MFKKKVIKDLGLKAKDFMFDFEFSAKILKKNKNKWTGFRKPPFPF